MNKEFEGYLINYTNSICNRNSLADDDTIEKNKNLLWQWIEQYGTEQRIDENKSFRKAIIDEAVLIDDEGKDALPDLGSAYEKGMDDVGRDLLKRVENRIRELKDE